MEFSDFFEHIHIAFPHAGTKKALFENLFASVGVVLGYADSNIEKLHSGKRPLSKDLKIRCRQAFNLRSASAFFQKLCSECNQQLVISEFGFSESEQIDTEALSIALAQQFKRIIDSDDSDVDNILSQAYRENCAKKISGEPPAEIQLPHYPGDDFFIPTQHVSKNAGCYETFQHTWEIENTGTQTWEDRCLCILESDRSDFTLVRMLEKSIRLPKTLPHQKQKITAHLETRGKEGKSGYYWVMQDASGNVCFPEQDCGSITVDVTFTL